jgi:preprotein translocase subunit SecF
MSDQSYRFDFLKFTKPMMVLSAILVTVSVIVVAVPLLTGGGLPFGLNPGLDFTGGTQIRVRFADDVSAEQIRAVISAVPLVQNEDLSKAVINDFSGGFPASMNDTKAIRMSLTDEADIEAVVDAIQSTFAGTEIVSREVIGGQISRELVSSGWQSTLLVLLVILIYLTWRFQFHFALGAVIALMHDVIIALGVFAILQIEINLPVIAAFLTIVGYSVNDTIVIFDRIRENLSAHRRGDPYHLVNLSLNQSLRRTVQTSLTTFIPVLVLTLFGGSVLFAFAFALLLGVIVGTYSSIFVASSLVQIWTKRAEPKRATAT